MWSISSTLDVTLQHEGFPYLIPASSVHDVNLAAASGNFLRGAITFIQTSDEGVVRESLQLWPHNIEPQQVLPDLPASHSEALLIFGHLETIITNLREPSYLGAILEIHQTNSPCASCQKVLGSVIHRVRTETRKPFIVRASAHQVYESAAGAIGRGLLRVRNRSLQLNQQHPARMEEIAGLHLVVRGDR